MSVPSEEPRPSVVRGQRAWKAPRRAQAGGHFFLPPTRSFLLELVALALLGAPTARAATDTWSGSQSVNWATVNGFNAVPASGDSLVFGTAGSKSATLNDNLTSTSFNLAAITFNAGGSAFTINGNAFTLTAGITNSNTASLETFNNAITLSSGYAGTLSTANGGLAFGGNLTGSNVNTLFVAGTGTTTWSGTNSFTFGANTSSYLIVGGTGGAGNANGNLQITGNTTFVGTPNGGSAGSYFAVDSNSTLTIAAGGSLTSGGGLNGFYVGLFNGNSFSNANGGGGAATMNVSGTLNIAADQPFRITPFPANGTLQSTVNVNAGGVVTVHSATTLGASGATSATINLNAGGTFASDNTISGASSPTAFNFNGGILRALAAQSAWLGGVSNVTTSASGSTIDANGYAVSITVPITDGTASGGLTITDSSASKGGVVTLSGANTFTGPVTVNGGTLRLQGVPILPSGLQIMPLGDSITWGYDGANAGYRGPLYNLLKSVAPNFLFVGSSVENNLTDTGSDALPSSEYHNEGHGSYTIQVTNNNLDGYDPSIFQQYGPPSRDPNGGHWFDGISDTSSANYRLPLYPDVILLLIGINDLGNGYDSTIQTRFHALLTKITTQRPAAKLIVAKIIPSTGRPGVDQYNAMETSEVASFQAAGKRIYLADLNTGFPVSSLVDGVHPNDAGFAFMTTQWYNALVADCATGYSASTGVPAGAALTLGAGSTLDLGGAPASVGSLAGSGAITLGGGTLTASNASGKDSNFAGAISGGGELTKTGVGTLTLSGSNTYTGATQISGGTLRVTGTVGGSSMDVANGTTLDLEGGTLNVTSIHVEAGGSLIGRGTINGTVTNDGTVSATGTGQTISFAGNVTNNGTMRFTAGAGLQVAGTLANYGTLDLLTASTGLPAGVVNHGGVAVDMSALHVGTVAVSQDQVTLTIPSYTGHFFQLQSTASLSPSVWQNTGGPQAGSSGTTLTFSDNPVSRTAGFYRIVVSP